ncbi:MAG: hypothetical protein ABI072_09015 [Edaphobacter sp.]
MNSPFGLDRTLSVLSPLNINRRAVSIAMRFACIAVLGIACRPASSLPPLTAYARSTVTVRSGFSQPIGVTVGECGDVFVADATNHAVKEFVTVGGVVSSSSTASNVPFGVLRLPILLSVEVAGEVDE